MKQIQKINSKIPNTIAIQRCQELGIDPHKSFLEYTSTEIDNLFVYLHMNKIPFNTLIPLNSLSMNYILDSFRCKRCGKCCQAIGDIPLMPHEPKKIANYLGVSTKSIKKLTKLKDGERIFESPCPFYKNGCSIQQVKPASCIAFPITDPIQIDDTIYLQLSTFCEESIKLAKRLNLMRRVFTQSLRPQQ